MKKPTLKLATWADYADVFNHRMTIIRAFSYLEVESLPCDTGLVLALQIETDDLHPPLNLHLRLKDFEGSLLTEFSAQAVPERTLTDRCVFQMVAGIQANLTKHDNSLEVSVDGYGVIGELALPIVTGSMKKGI